MHIENDLGADLAAAALIGLSGIGEAVADHDAARIESRLNDLGDGLGAVGKHEGHFRHGRHGDGTGVEQDLADAVAGCGAAGLAQQHGFLAAAREPCRQTLDLRGFARPIEAFERNENTARHGVSLSPRLRQETSLFELCYKRENSSKPFRIQAHGGLCPGGVKHAFARHVQVDFLRPFAGRSAG